MKQIQIDLPEKLADQIESLVRGGWFSNEQELVRTAIIEFFRHRGLELTEEFQREDIAWALQHRTACQ
jgi:Arc/MetJ-type ribon-helix-helix transcriptional regulator